MDKIDLDTIIQSKVGSTYILGRGDVMVVMKEAIRQALVLASKKVKVKDIANGLFGGGDLQVDEQSILDVNDLII